MGLFSDFIQSSGGSSAIGGVSGLLQSGINAAMGKAQREHEWNMYIQQRNDAISMYERQLSDQRDLIADERAYNSPAAQAARLRAAGKNPDLQDISNVPSSAGSAPSFSNPAPTVSNLAGIFDDALTSAVSVAMSFEDMRSRRIDNDVKSLNLFSFFPEIGMSSIQASGIKAEDITKPEVVNSLIPYLQKNYPHLSRRTRRALEDFTLGYIKSDAVRKQLTEEATAADAAAMDNRWQRSSPYYSQDILAEIPTAMADTAKFLTDLTRYQAKHQRDYYRTANGAYAAQSDNYRNIHSSFREKTLAFLSSKIDECVKNKQFLSVSYYFRAYSRILSLWSPDFGSVGSGLGTAAGAAVGGPAGAAAGGAIGQAIGSMF